MKCHKCGSEQVARILYGLPVFNEELEQQIAERKLVLGGCCLSGSDPRYHCFGCGKDIGKPPIFRGKFGIEDYREIITGVYFSCGGYDVGYEEVTLRHPDGPVEVLIKPSFIYDAGRQATYRLGTEEEWQHVIRALFDELYLHEWKKRYVYPEVLDGTQWELTMKLTGGRKREYYGSNQFPYRWTDLVAVFDPYFKEAGATMQLKGMDE